jgi:hypothetical protein
MKVTATVHVTVEREDGTATTVAETCTESDASGNYTERQNARAVGERALARVLDRVGNA